MLNGLDPILIFNLSKTVSFLKTNITDKKIPVASQILDKIDLPVIPIYLSRELTGLQIDNESKSLEIETVIETIQDSSEKPFINQRALNNTIKVEIVAEKDSIGLTLLAALADFVFPLVTAKEITMTYLHGPITVFAGLLHSFNISQESNTSLYKITMEFVKVGIAQAKQIPSVENKLVTNLGAAAKPAV